MNTNSNLKISIVIPAKNAEKTIALCLNSLCVQTSPFFEIIVVDNDSNDKTFQEIQRVKSYFKNDLSIKVVSVTPSSRGKARQVGILESRGDIVVMIDSDCIADENWLEELMKPLAGNVCVVVGHTNVKPTGPYSKIIQELDNEFLMSNSAGPFLDSFTSTQFGISRAALDTLRFNPQMKAAEDFDFWLQMKKQGIASYFVPSAQVSRFVSDNLLSYFGKSFSRGFFTYLSVKNNDFVTQQEKKKIYLQKGLSTRKLLFSFAWAFRRLLVLPFQSIDSRQKIVLTTIGELSWQSGVSLARLYYSFDRMMRPRNILRPSARQ